MSRSLSEVAMGKVELDFRPSVPVLDANVSLGRRHDRAVAVDTVEGVRREMDRAGIGRALVYAPHAATYDSVEGNSMLMESVRGRDDFVPQFVCNPAFDDLEQGRGARGGGGRHVGEDAAGRPQLPVPGLGRRAVAGLAGRREACPCGCPSSTRCWARRTGSTRATCTRRWRRGRT